MDTWDWVENFVEGKDPGSNDPRFSFDAINGTLRFRVRTQCASCSNVAPLRDKIVEISGFANLLDIIPTFQPATGTLSWNTPKHPEALPAADRFMAFAGDLRDVGDLTQTCRRHRLRRDSRHTAAARRLPEHPRPAADTAGGTGQLRGDWRGE